MDGERVTAQGDDVWPKGVGQPAIRAFALAGYDTPDDLTKARPSVLLRLHGVGPKAIRVLTAWYAEQGKSFAGE